MKRLTGYPATAAGVLIIVAAAGFARASVTKDGAFYRIKIDTKAAGDDVTATIKITGKTGYHCNMLYPWKLTVTPGDGVTMPKTKFKKADAAKFAESGVVFRVPYHASGAATVTAKLKLSLCDEKQCKMETVDLSWPAR